MDVAQKENYFSLEGWRARFYSARFQLLLSLHKITREGVNEELNKLNQLLKEAECEDLPQITSLRKEIVTKIFLMCLGIDTCTI